MEFHMHSLADEKIGWNKAWSFEGSRSWYPDEQVIRFLAGYYAQRIGTCGQSVKHKFPDRTLIGVDYGCGPGRHMVAMQQHQIQAHGIDLSNVVVAGANALLRENGYPENAVAGSLSEMQFANDQFDLGVCHGVLDHMTLKTRAKSISEIFRTLRKKAKILISFISENDSAFGEGTQIDETTWTVSDGYEKDLPQAFFNEERVLTELRGFNVISLTEVTNKTIRGRSLIGTDKHYAVDSRYYVVAEKNENHTSR